MRVSLRSQASLTFSLSFLLTRCVRSPFRLSFPSCGGTYSNGWIGWNNVVGIFGFPNDPVFPVDGYNISRAVLKCQCYDGGVIKLDIDSSCRVIGYEFFDRLYGLYERDVYSPVQRSILSRGHSLVSNRSLVRQEFSVFSV
jgi:hypothetical protein